MAFRWPSSWWPFPKPQPPKPPDPPRPPATQTLQVQVFDGDPALDEKVPGALVRVGGDQATTDGAGNCSFSGLIANVQYGVHVEAAGFVPADRMIPGDAHVAQISLTPAFTPLTPWGASRKVFTENSGAAIRYRGFTGFNFIDKLAKGGWDPFPFLLAYGGCNVVRTFCYTPVKDWGASAWGWPTLDQVATALHYLEGRGLRMELVLLTDDDPARLEPAAALVRQLAILHPPNLLLEIGNEPEANGKSINTAALRSTLDASGFLYSSGNYEDSTRWFGRYYTCHTQRTPDWTRRAHDLLDFYDGTGPDQATHPHPVPCVGDEPGKVQDVGGKPSEWRAYFGACSLLGAGATIHLETGKLCNLPTAQEQSCIAAALGGLSAFPPDAPFGPYRRITEPGNEPGGPTSTSRTYVVGGYAVRCQQPGTAFPEPGWTALDDQGVLWRK